MTFLTSIRRRRTPGRPVVRTVVALVLAGLVVSLLEVGAPQARALQEAPSTPTNLRVLTATQTSITIAWDASTGGAEVDGYQIVVDRSRPFRTLETRFSLVKLHCGRTYNVEVAAYDEAKNVSLPVKAFVSTTPCVDLEPPSVPTGLTQLAVGPTSVALSWNASSDNVAVAGYAVSRDGLELGTTNQASYTLSGLTCGRTYQADVRAFDVARNYSAWARFYVTTASCGDLSPPSAPTGLVQTNRNATGMSLAWSPSVDNIGVARYDVFVAAGQVGSTREVAYTLTNLACGSAYTVAVEAVDAAGNRSSRSSATMSTGTCAAPSPTPTTDTQRPSTPSNLSLAAASPTSITLTWSPSTDNVGVVGYGAYRNGVRMQVVTGTTFVFQGLACGASHLLGVEAYDASGNHSRRASVTASTTPCSDTSAPTAPASPFLLDRSPTSITVGWAASSDDVAVVGYGAYVDGVLDGSTATTMYTFAGLQCNKSFVFGFDAYDAVGNRSSRLNVPFSTTACDDTQAPTAPAQLTVSSPTASTVTLTWSASSDGSGVAGYDAFVNGTKVLTVTGTSTTLMGLTCATTYTFGVEAFDAAGNRSSRKAAVGTTAPCPNAPPTSGTVYISPSGSDAGLCTIALPCASFDRAYKVAQPGTTVTVGVGSYPPQTMTFDSTKSGATSRVVFDLGQATIAGNSTLWGVQHVEFRGGEWTKLTMRPSDARGLVPGASLTTDVVVSQASMKSFLIRNGQQVTIRDSDVGGFDVSSDLGVPKVGSYPGEDGAAEQPSRDVLIERTTFRDITRAPGATQHAECLFIEGGVERITVRGSSFTNCAVFDIFVEPRGVLVSDIVFQNNMFDVPRDSDGTSSGSAVSLKGGPFRNVDISWNSIHGNVRTDSAAPDWGASGTLVFKGNAWRNSNCGTWPSASFVGNVGLNACSSSDVGGDPGFVSARTDPCDTASCYRNDLHLSAGALALNRAPAGAPSDDFDGEARPQGSAPDVGADERS